MHVTRKYARDIFGQKNARDNLWLARDKNRIFLPVTKKNARDILGIRENARDISKKLPVTFDKNFKKKTQK